MTEPQQQSNVVVRSGRRVFKYVRENPHLGLSVALFFAGGIATALKTSPLAGALFGAGAALLGAWITELNKRRTDAEDKAKKQSEAQECLAPELYRTIERVLYINDRAAVNFSCASADNQIKPNDLKEDFLPYLPVLYPSAPQVKDLPGANALALIRFYDSLHTLALSVEGWWQREGQLPVNLFNSFLHSSERSLRRALVCIEAFDLERAYPPEYESWGTLTSRIERSLSSAERTRQNHIDRFNAKSTSKASR